MNGLVRGLLIGVGIGIVIGLIVLILRGEDQRRFLQERFQQARGALPEREQVQLYAQQTATRVSQFAGNAKDTVEQTMKKMKPSGSDGEEKAIPLSSVES